MATICPQCTQGHIIEAIQPKGRMESNGAYYSPASSTQTEKAIVLLTDAFGLNLPNPKIIADRLSERLGIDVWVPVVFEGRPPLPESDLAPYLPDVPGTKLTLMQRLGFVLVILRNLPAVIRNRVPLVGSRAQAFVRTLKEEKLYTRIGAIGYCLGGAAAVLLAGTTLISTVVIAHPAPITKEDVRNIKTPASWICSEEDPYFPTQFRLECEAMFASRQDGIQYEFIEYKGTVHGFGSRPDFGNPTIKAAFDGAFEQAVEWFTRTL